MTKLQKIGTKNPRKNKISNSKPMVTDFGTRQISHQNFSRIVALPKMALQNCGLDTSNQVNVKLVQENGERYIKLSPTSKKGDERN